MNILIVTPIFTPQIGGPATYTEELVKRLIPGHQVTIIAFGEKLTKLEGVKIVSIPLFGGVLGAINRQAVLARAIATAAKETDVIYAQGALVVGFVSSLIARIQGKPLIIKFVGDEVWEEALRKGKTNLNLEEFLADRNKSFSLTLQQKLQSLSLKSARRVVVPSHYLKRILSVFYKVNSEKIEVIDNAVEIPQTEKHTKNIIVSSGRLVPHKRFELVIEAFAKLQTKLPKEVRKTLKLHIIGEGSSKGSLERVIEKESLTGRVKLLGGLPKGEYLRRVQEAKLFVLASSYEGLPHAIIEAMLSGIPVVASDIPGNREVIEHEKTGLIVPATMKDISEAMKRILTDKEFANELTQNAKKNAQARFGWRTHIERLVHLFG